MTHCRPRILHSNSILTFTIASVISGWASGGGSASGDDSGGRFDPNEWPPHKTKVVEGVESIPKGSTVTVGPADASKPDEINYLKMVNGTLNIEGSLTSELPSGDKVQAGVHMIVSAVGLNNKVTNQGVLSSARDKSGYAADVIMALTKYGDNISNEGTLIVQGIKRRTVPIAFQAVHKSSQAANEINGTFNILGAPAIGFLVINGLGSNSGTLNLSSQSSSDQPSYGMKARNQNIHDSVDQGNAEIRNRGTLNVNGKNNYGMAATVDANQPPPDGYSSTAANWATINVAGDGSVGMSTDTHRAKVDNTGNIFTKDNGTGIKISGNGQLVNAGTVRGTGTGLLYSGNFPRGLSIRPGYVIEGSPAIKMEQADQSPLHLYGGHITGNIESVDGRDNALHIAPLPEKAPGKDTTVSVKGNISGFSTIDISGTSWNVNGWISGVTCFDTSSAPGLKHMAVYHSGNWSVSSVASLPERLTITAGLKGEIEEITTNPPSNKPRSLNLSFSQSALDGQGELVVRSFPGSTIKTIDLSSKDDRPALLMLLQGGEAGTIKGRSDLNDQLVLHKGSVTGAINDISTIMVTNDNASAWSVAGPLSNPNSITINDGAKINYINSYSSRSSYPGTLNLVFNPTYTKSDLVKVDNHGTLVSLDFSSDAHRPSLHFVQSSGGANLVKARYKMNDTLIMVSGIILEMSGFDNLIIQGDKWDFLRMNNPVIVNVVKGAVVNRITNDLSAKKGTNLLVLDFTKSFPNRSVFAIKNEGGEIHEIDISKPNSVRPPLLLNHLDGIIENIKGQPDHGDSLFLSGGKITESVSGIDNIWITGKHWESIAIQNPLSITVTEDGTVGLMTTRDADPAGGASALPLKFTQSATPFKNVPLNTRGTIGEIKFDNPTTAKRSPINIIQKGGSIGSILSLAGKGDTLDVQNGTVKSDIIGLDSLTFSGKDTQFGGQRIETMGTMTVSGKLTLTSNQKVSVTPVKKVQSTPGATTDATTDATTLHIKKGSTLSATRSNTALEVEGIYKQDGKLEVQLDKQSNPKVPYVKANSVEIGPDAVVWLKNQPDVDESTEYYILMQSSDSNIKTQPLLVTTSFTPHTLYYLRLAAKQLFLVSYHVATPVGDLARSGGANDSASKAIAIALTARQSDDNAPLNSWLLSQIKRLNNNPAEVAKTANQMTPDLSGASISSATAAIRQARTAVGARQSGLRTGIAAGDMVTSGNVWIQYANTDATQDKKDGYNGYKAKTHGFTLGVDSDLNQRMTLGVAYTYSKGDVKGTDDSTSRFDTEGHTLSVYSSFGQGPVFVDGRIGYNWSNNVGKRQVVSNGIKVKYDVNSWDLGLLTGYKIPLGQSGEWRWMPQLAFNYVNIKPDDYRELSINGWSDILRFARVKSDTYEILELGAGLKLSGDIATARMIVKPEVSLMAFHDFKDDPVTMTAQFAQGGNAFVVNGAKREQNRYQFDAVVNMESHSNLAFTLSYHYDWTDSYKAHGVIARVSYEF